MWVARCLVCLLAVVMAAQPAASQSDACAGFAAYLQRIGPETPIRFDETTPACLERYAGMVEAAASRLARAGHAEKALRMLAEYSQALGHSPQWLLLQRSALMQERQPSVSPGVPTAPPRHLFTHSLIVDASLAFDGDFDSAGYNDWMLTVQEFRAILESLHQRGYVLVDIESLVEPASGGGTALRPLALPAGKIPLIWSFDDVNYYDYMRGDGFAERLVLDEQGRPANTYRDRAGNVITSTQLDAIPILEAFVSAHPDFSWQGARGIIAVTGYEGVLGWRTQGGRDARAVQQAQRVADALKARGWKFASHSHGHHASWRDRTASLAAVRADLARWNAEVAPIVGDTRIFIGPFGTIWDVADPRRTAIVSAGFDILCSVDASQRLDAHGTHVSMGRLNVDGFRMKRTPGLLAPFFDVRAVLDPARPK